MGAKLTDWQDRLSDYLNAVERKPFDWATHSCLTFVTGAVTAMTGEDFWKADRDHIRSLGGRSLIVKHMQHYGGDLEGAADKALALAGAVRRKTPGEGDIVLAQSHGVTMLGVCMGRLFASVARDGITFGIPDNIRAVWRIG